MQSKSSPNKRAKLAASSNRFLTDPLATLFVKTAAPIILIMLANGLYTLVDAYYLGKYVGPDALTAVTLMFPMYMLIVALSTLVSSGYASVLARRLGAGSGGELALTGALSLSMLVALALVILFVPFGYSMVLMLANGDALLADFGYIYIAILVAATPLGFLLGIGVDTLRCQGKMALMTGVTVLSTLLNFVFNYVFIVQLQLGVAGSAYGTVVAQICALILVIVLRSRGEGLPSISLTRVSQSRSYWKEFLVLGVPPSLNYIGISLVATVTIFSLQKWGLDNYAATAGAYGINTRVMTFAVLPLLGLSMAFQTIVGNNFGASAFYRSNTSLKLVLWIATGYCALVQLTLYLIKDSIGTVFVDDPLITAEISRILPMSTMMLVLFGPVMMLTAYFQAIGDSSAAAILGLSRTYLFALPFVFCLPYVLGENGIWYAGPSAEFMMLVLALVVLLKRRRQWAV